MRTMDEIAAQMGAEKTPLGFNLEVYVEYLDLAHARPFLKEDSSLTEAEWNKTAHPLTEEQVKKDMLEYLTFAWEKCENERSISAYRSIEKMKAWLWILGDDELVTFLSNKDNFGLYGAPMLRRITEKYGTPDMVPESLR